MESVIRMKSDIEVVANRLVGDWDFVEAFLNDAGEALSEYHLSGSERAALVARNASAIERLGFDRHFVEQFLSGAHSQQCS